MNAAGVAAFGARLQTALEEVFPATIRLGTSSTDLAAATVGLKRADALGEGGFTLEDTISFRVRKSLVETRPALGTALLWTQRSLTFAVDEVRESAVDNSWLLVCKNPNAR